MSGEWRGASERRMNKLREFALLARVRCRHPPQDVASGESLYEAKIEMTTSCAQIFGNIFRMPKSDERKNCAAKFFLANHERPKVMDCLELERKKISPSSLPLLALVHAAGASAPAAAK